MYASTPAPLKIPTTPAPTTRWGGWAFHAGLFLALLAHLRYFTEPVWWWVALLSQLSPYAGLLMLFGLSGLLARRFLVDRVRYISAPSDYLMLVFLIAIAGSGLAMRYGLHADIVQVKMFALGLITFEFRELGANPVLILHLGLVAILLLIFPFSKLLHAPGLFFSPSRNQVDNPRERRHIARWAKAYDASTSSEKSSG